MPRLTSKCSNSIFFLFLLLGLDVLHHLVRLPLAAKEEEGRHGGSAWGRLICCGRAFARGKGRRWSLHLPCLFILARPEGAL